MAEGPNQGATGQVPPGQQAAGPTPQGESPLSADSEDGGAFAERPELFVGGAFVGGLALALIVRRVSR
ncbi:MAG TPA: hypothetical protein VFQ12_08175 [Thermoleophilaceae bacterium]|nr:hypothetical protein [Thermoleophilaceae bacterium]